MAQGWGMGFIEFTAIHSRPPRKRLQLVRFLHVFPCPGTPGRTDSVGELPQGEQGLAQWEWMSSVPISHTVQTDPRPISHVVPSTFSNSSIYLVYPITSNGG